MTRALRLAAVASAGLLAIGLAGCTAAGSDGSASGSDTTSGCAATEGEAAAGQARSAPAETADAGSGTEAVPALAGSAATPAAAASTEPWEPVTIEHAFGETAIDERPERVATVDWSNQEVPLALGVVPVGFAKTTWGDDDGDGVHPWVEDKLAELGAETPALFDETDGYDFEAVADTDPDLILAPYSGLTQEDYDTFSEIAPVVAYPETAWGTPWRQTIEISSAALGMAEAGEQLIADLETKIDEAVSEYPELDGATAMMVTHVDVNDLSTLNFYSAYDTRGQFFEDLGMKIPESLKEVSEEGKYNGSVSSEQADIFTDVDIFVTYGGQELIDALESDPLLSQLPAVCNGAIVNLPGDKPLGTAANPTALQIPALIDDYAAALGEAAKAANAG